MFRENTKRYHSQKRKQNCQIGNFFFENFKKDFFYFSHIINLAGLFFLGKLRRENSYPQVELVSEVFLWYNFCSGNLLKIYPS
jgi:hypothetical protein